MMVPVIPKLAWGMQKYARVPMEVGVNAPEEPPGREMLKRAPAFVLLAAPEVAVCEKPVELFHTMVVPRVMVVVLLFETESTKLSPTVLTTC